jgi:hypothetical protein
MYTLVENGDKIMAKIGEFTKILGNKSGCWQKYETSIDSLLQCVPNARHLYDNSLNYPTWRTKLAEEAYEITKLFSGFVSYFIAQHQ